MAASHTHPWSTPTSQTTGIASATIATGGNVALGDAIDNDSNLDTDATLEIAWSYAVAPTANKQLLIRLLRSLDGTNYEDSKRGQLVGSITPPADTSAHRMAFRLGLVPTKFKIEVENVDTAQTVTVTATIKTYRMATEAVA
jgi:hypothetical protein